MNIKRPSPLHQGDPHFYITSWKKDKIWPMEQTILHFENDLKRINDVEEIHIMKATISAHILNINNNPLYKILQPFQDQLHTKKQKCCIAPYNIKKINTWIHEQIMFIPISSVVFPDPSLFSFIKSGWMLQCIWWNYDVIKKSKCNCKYNIQLF